MNLKICRCAIAAAAEELPIVCEAKCGEQTCQVDVKSSNSGLHQCAFVPTSAGFYRISASSNGWELKHSPISVQARSWRVSHWLDTSSHIAWLSMIFVKGQHITVHSMRCCKRTSNWWKKQVLPCLSRWPEKHFTLYCLFHACILHCSTAKGSMTSYSNRYCSQWKNSW